MKTLTFIKDSIGDWYVDLPEWTGPKEDLEMVLGADQMLELLSQGESIIDVTLDTNPFDSYKFTLERLKDEGGGAWYKYESKLGQEFEIWLCYVTKFVFGELPEKLYCL